MLAPRPLDCFPWGKLTANFGLECFSADYIYLVITGQTVFPRPERYNDPFFARFMLNANNGLE